MLYNHFTKLRTIEQLIRTKLILKEKLRCTVAVPMLIDTRNKKGSGKYV